MNDLFNIKELNDKVRRTKRFIRNNESIIYCLIKNNNIVYIGQSTEFLQRLAAHSREKRGLFDSYAVIENLGTKCDYQTLIDREKYYIKLVKPKLNKVYLKNKSAKK